MNPVLLVVIAIALVVVVAIAVANGRRRNDGVDSFRRQIDALSPEARRSVVDQVQNAAERQRSDDDEEAADGDADEGGARGS